MRRRRLCLRWLAEILWGVAIASGITLNARLSWEHLILHEGGTTSTSPPTHQGRDGTRPSQGNNVVKLDCAGRPNVASPSSTRLFAPSRTTYSSDIAMPSHLRRETKEWKMEKHLRPPAVTMSLDGIKRHGLACAHD